MDSSLKNKTKQTSLLILNFIIVLLRSFWLTFELNVCKEESILGSGQWKQRRGFTATDTEVWAGGILVCAPSRTGILLSHTGSPLKMASSLCSLFHILSCLAHPWTPCHGSPWEASYTPSDKRHHMFKVNIATLTMHVPFFRIPACFRRYSQSYGLVNYLFFFFANVLLFENI